ncbi:MAG TPA: Rv3235 family protein [Streptosporangiaceae bacterium]
MPTQPTNPRQGPAGPLRPHILPLAPGDIRPPDQRRPLPDAAAVRRLEIPDHAPPYDDELPAPAPGLVPAAPSGNTAPPRPAPRSDNGGTTGPAPRPDNAATGRPAPRPDNAASPGPAPRPGKPPAAPGPAPGQPGRPGGSKQAGAWPGQFAQVLAETLAGQRSSRQLVPWTTDQARQRIRLLGAQLSASHRPVVHRPVVQRVLASHPVPGVVEMTVVVRFGSRIQALAIRLEQQPAQPPAPGRLARPQRWRCTAVEAA